MINPLHYIYNFIKNLIYQDPVSFVFILLTGMRKKNKKSLPKSNFDRIFTMTKKHVTGNVMTKLSSKTFLMLIPGHIKKTALEDSRLVQPNHSLAYSHWGGRPK